MFSLTAQAITYDSTCHAKQMDSKPTDHLTEFKQTTCDFICLTKSLSLSVYPHGCLL